MTSEEDKPEIRVRVWKSYLDEDGAPKGRIHLENEPHVWKWRVTYSDGSGSISIQTPVQGAESSQWRAKWAASRQIKRFRKQFGIGRRDPIDVFFEAEPDQVSERDLRKAARRLQEIEDDLNG